MNSDLQIALETKLAEHEHNLSQLSDEIYRQQRHIEKLQKQLDQLVAYIKAHSDDENQTDTPIDRPPHY